MMPFRRKRQADPEASMTDEERIAMYGKEAAKALKLVCNRMSGCVIEFLIPLGL